MSESCLAENIIRSGAVDKNLFIKEKCRGKRVLDLGCIRHDAESALKDRNWMHKIIKEVSAETVGVDYLPEEIRKMKAAGHDIVFGDVTKPLDVVGKFDVIVAGDLIEHLTNFDGFFDNFRKLLKPDGIAILTTANPFYSGEFHYLAFKKNFLVNPEHTCWVDPQCLEQLCERSGFRIDEIHYIKNSWRLGAVICQTKRHRYDIHMERWLNDSFAFKLFRVASGWVFQMIYIPYRFICGTGSALVRHSDYLAVLRLK